jgi:hypothetical protein
VQIFNSFSFNYFFFCSSEYSWLFFYNTNKSAWLIYPFSGIYIFIYSPSIYNNKYIHLPMLQPPQAIFLGTNLPEFLIKRLIQVYMNLHLSNLTFWVLQTLAGFGKECRIASRFFWSRLKKTLHSHHYQQHLILVYHGANEDSQFYAAIISLPGVVTSLTVLHPSPEPMLRILPPPFN